MVKSEVMRSTSGEVDVLESCVVGMFYIFVSSFGYWRCLLGLLCFKWLLVHIHVWMFVFCETVLVISV